MAEGLFGKAAAGKGYEVSSAGVSACDGAAASPETVAILEEDGISLADFQSRMVTEEILLRASHVFCLTSGHLGLLQARFPKYEDKYYLATEFAEIGGKVGKDVSDPFGGSRAEYDAVAGELKLAVAGILGFLGVGGKPGKSGKS